jgi:hypothetical protein
VGADSSSDIGYTVVYCVDDLAVWERLPKTGIASFNPGILIRHIQAEGAPESWKFGGEIRPWEKQASLVIKQTKQNHHKISMLLDSLHDEADALRLKSLSQRNQ